MKPVSGIPTQLINAGKAVSGPQKTDKSFSDRLKGLMEDVNQKQHHADVSVEKVIKGELGIHEGMLSIHEADVSLKYFVKVREKVIGAYNEIRKMPV